MSAIPRYSISPNSGEILVGGTAFPWKTILDPSQTYHIGDFVYLTATNGYVTPAATTAKTLFGVIVAVCKPDGSQATPDSGTTNTWTTTSTNATTEKLYAVVNISTDAIYSVGATATLGTTTGSNILGYYIALNNATTVLESSASTTATQLLVWGVDPDDSTRILVSILQTFKYGLGTHV